MSQPVAQRQREKEGYKLHQFCICEFDGRGCFWIVGLQHLSSVGQYIIMAFLAIVNFGFVRFALLLTLHALPNYPIRPRQNFGRDRQADLLGGFEINHELELQRLLHGQVGGFGSFQNLVDENRGALKNFDSIGIVGGEAASFDTGNTL